jgi:hypothetical protein
MSFYTCFDWLKKLRLFSYERNLKLALATLAGYIIFIKKTLGYCVDWIIWLLINEIEKFSYIQMTHMSFYTCFDWLKKLRLFSYERNLKLDVVLKVSHAVVIRWFSLNETALGLLYKMTCETKINLFVVNQWSLVHRNTVLTGNFGRLHYFHKKNFGLLCW